ncbi:hypothetical protein [Streptomyces mesophilus]|uniref:hypothetical protein n=1 Tax=Streptomyces mesophilus TaxID=1775132 RepID=UPI003328A9FB
MPTSSRKNSETGGGDRRRRSGGEGGGSGRVITDEASFDAMTSEPRQVAALYFYLQMDHVVCAAHRVALSAVEQPQLFTRLREKGTSGNLARLRARYGHDERVPDGAQRSAIFQGAFQETAAQSMHAMGEFSFPKERDALLDASRRYAERVYDTSVDLLLAGVRDAHVTMLSLLQGLHGDTLIWNVEESLGSIARQLAYPVLHDAGVNAVFGITAPPVSDWPFVEDSNADKLLEEIDRRIPLPAAPGADRLPPTTRTSSAKRQLAALRGAEAIIAILDFPQNGPTDQLVELASRCFLWHKALHNLGPAQPRPQGPELTG